MSARARSFSFFRAAEGALAGSLYASPATTPSVSIPGGEQQHEADDCDGTYFGHWNVRSSRPSNDQNRWLASIGLIIATLQKPRSPVCSGSRRCLPAIAHHEDASRGGSFLFRIKRGSSRGGATSRALRRGDSVGKTARAFFPRGVPDLLTEVAEMPMPPASDLSTWCGLVWTGVDG